MPERSLKRVSAILVLIFTGACATQSPSTAIEFKTVVVTMFEHGEARGDRPGELQYWVERLPDVYELPFPAGEAPLYASADDVLVVLVGGGIPNATASIMALGLDPRFDLSQSYWLVTGIAGGDPADVSLGSAAWARHVVDGDLLFEIDAREMPADWPYGIIPLGGERPAEEPGDIFTGWTVDTIHFALNAALADWAYETTKDLTLKDTPEMRVFRQQFNEPAARRPPFVTMGDTLSASTYWHGHALNNWANDWVRLYAGADANFMTSNMEDSGTLTALGRLSRVDRADMDRILVLRVASNYTVPPPGKTVAWSTTAEYPNQGEPALDTAYQVGRVVIDALLAGWPAYAEKIPEPSASGDQP